MKKLCIWGLLIAVTFSLTSCGNREKVSEDIVTQKVSSEEKIPITVLVKYAFSINSFEAALEKVFPNVDLIQVGNYTGDMGIADYEARIAHDDLTDIVMTWPLETGEEYWEERLLDLSSMSFTNKYNTARLDSISKDGKLYYLPGPSQIRGIVYNKTLFEENGWEVPKDFEGSIRLCKTIEATGIRALQLGFGNAEVLDTAFVGSNLASSYSKPEDAKWIAQYNEGTGNFIDHFGTALDVFQTLIDEGVLKKEDLQITYADRENMMKNRQCAMIEDSVLMHRILEELPGVTDEFALMPFFNPGEDSDWVRIYPVCYIGLNKHLEEEKNKEKYDLVLQIMEYISTPEGQDALIQDNGTMFSALNGMELPDVPEIKDLRSALMGDRYAVFPTLKNAQGALRKGLAGMLEGTMTASDVGKMVDAENLSPPVEEKQEVIGSASEDFNLIDTGNFVTDAMRAESGCEIALFLDNGKDGTYNGKGISAKLYKGDLTEQDIKRILPDLKQDEKGELWKITMSGQNLIQTLEYAIPVYEENDGWFYYFSGLKMEFAPAAEQGKRIRKISDDKGNEIEKEKMYTIAVMDESVKEDLMESKEETGIKISDILIKTIQDKKVISKSEDGRFVVVKP